VPRLRRPRSPVHAARRAAAVLLGLAALALALRPGPAPTAAPADVPVVVAAAGLPAGRTLDSADLAVARLPPGTVPDGVVAEPGSLVGRVLAGAVRTGEPLTDARLVGPGVTTGLPAGQVAAPVRLADLAVAALVRTGDRVDVLAVADGAAGADAVAENALVLAAGGSDDDPSAGLLLVAVDPQTAGRLAVAAATATLTVSLPPP
jgi:pilus assembly protein CpaB